MRSNVISRAKSVNDWLLVQFAALTGIEVATNDLAELSGNKNCVVLSADAFVFDDDRGNYANFSIFVKNSGSDSWINDDVIIDILNLLEKDDLNGDAIETNVLRVYSRADGTFSKKDIISVIEIEIYF